MRKLLQNKSLNYSLLDQALVSGSNFISTLIIARLLGLYDFGIFATLWLILLFINSIHASVIVLPMMTLVPKQKKIKEYFGSLLIGQVIFLILSFIIAYVLTVVYLGYMDTNISLHTILLFNSTVLLYHAQDFYRRYFFSIKEFKNVFIIDFLTYFLRIVVLLPFLLYSIDITLNDIFLIFIITYGFGILVAIFKYSSIIKLDNLKVDFHKHWEMSKWLLPSGIMQWTSINFFLVLSSFILGPIAIGAIRIGQNIVLAFNIILQGIENFIPTDASKIYQKQGIKAFNEFLIKVTIIGLAVASLFGIIISYFSTDIISTLYGDIYAQYNNVIIWYSLILLFMFILIVVRILLRTIEKTKLWFHAYLIASIYSIIVAYPLIYLYKLNGVMFGILTAHIVLLTSVYFMLKKEDKNVYN